jgi:hypothetical protein
MENEIKYGQENFTLPHDVISLPSKGVFYKNKKASIKVGYLTASDENILMSPNVSKDGIIFSLLRQKIYEPGFNINEMLDCDVQAVLLFLRNTAFGSDYNFTITDPANGKTFETTILLDEIDYIKPQHEPDENGYFTYKLPKSGAEVKLKLLTIGEQKELDKLTEQYPIGMTAPVITKKLEKQIVELNGTTDKGKISQFVNQMPILDSKSIRKFISECEPKINLERKVNTPSGEEVSVNITFGVEFFRPFF